MKSLVLLFTLLLFKVAVAAEPASILAWFDVDHTLFVSLPEDLMPVPVDVEANGEGKVRAARVDLNKDGVPEYFIPGACGKGGCDYLFYDGASKRQVGDLFGSRLWIVGRMMKGWPVVLSYSPGHGNGGTQVEYAFDGQAYAKIRQLELTEQAVTALFDRFRQAPALR